MSVSQAQIMSAYQTALASGSYSQIVAASYGLSPGQQAQTVYGNTPQAIQINNNIANGIVNPDLPPETQAVVTTNTPSDPVAQQAAALTDAQLSTSGIEAQVQQAAQQTIQTVNPQVTSWGATANQLITAVNGALANPGVTAALGLAAGAGVASLAQVVATKKKSSTKHKVRHAKTHRKRKRG